MNIKYLIPLMFLILLAMPTYAYTIRTNFYDETTLTVIPTVTITDANGSTYTSDVNGLWSIDLVGAKSFEISKTGYDSRPLEFYFTADTNYNFLLNPTGLDSNIGFIVKDSNDNLWTNKYLMFSTNTRLLNFWNLDYNSYVSQYIFLVASAENIYFRSDGIKLYTVNTSTDKAYEYTLGTAWDITTITLTNEYSVSAKETAPTGMYFSSDGIYFYIIGGVSDNVHQYTLGTAWDISTANFTRSFSVSAKEAYPYDVFFNSIGTYMYIIGTDSDSVHQYTLGTAWDISTANFTRSFSVSAKETDPRTMFFKPDGKVMFVGGRSSDSVHQYNLSIEWNISSAVFYKTFSESTPTDIIGMYIPSLGNQLIISKGGTGRIVKYDIGTLTPAIINSLLTSSQGYATANILPAGDYNALLYNATGDLNYTYEKTTVTVNKPKNEKTSALISPYDIYVSGLLQYSLTNQTASSATFNVFAGTTDFYTFTAVDYNAVVADQKYIPKSYFVQVPMGNSYVNAITYQPYLLLKTDGIVPKVVVLDQLNRTIENAQIYVSKYVGGVLTVVESGNTFSNGAFNFSAYPLDVYYLTVYYNETDYGTFSVQPRDSSDIFYIKIDRTTVEDIAQALIIQTNLDDTSRYQNRDTNINVLGTITSNFNYITDYNVNVYERGNLVYSSNTVATGQSIDINKFVDVNLIPDYVHSAVIKIIVNYSIAGVTGSQTFSKNIMITDSPDVIGTIEDAQTEIGQPLSIFIALAVAIMLMAVLIFSGILTDPAILAVFGALVIGVFMMLGFLDIGVVVLGMDIGRFAYFLGLMATLYFALFGGR